MNLDLAEESETSKTFGISAVHETMNMQEKTTANLKIFFVYIKFKVTEVANI